MRKKVFAIILTLCMVLTMMPAVAWAVDIVETKLVFSESELNIVADKLTEIQSNLSQEISIADKETRALFLYIAEYTNGALTKLDPASASLVLDVSYLIEENGSEDVIKEDNGVAFSKIEGTDNGYNVTCNVEQSAYMPTNQGQFKYYVEFKDYNVGKAVVKVENSNLGGSEEAQRQIFISPDGTNKYGWWNGRIEGVTSWNSVQVFLKNNLIKDYEIYFYDPDSPNSKETSGKFGTISKNGDGTFTFTPNGSGEKYITIEYGGQTAPFTIFVPDSQESENPGNPEEQVTCKYEKWFFAKKNVNGDNTVGYERISIPDSDSDVKTPMWFISENDNTNSEMYLLREKDGSTDDLNISYRGGDQITISAVAQDVYEDKDTGKTYQVWKITATYPDNFDRAKLNFQFGSDSIDAWILGEDYKRADNNFNRNNIVLISDIPENKTWSDFNDLNADENIIEDNRFYLDMSQEATSDRNSFYVIYDANKTLNVEATQYFGYELDGTSLNGVDGGKFEKKLDAGKKLTTGNPFDVTIGGGVPQQKAVKVSLNEYLGYENIRLSFTAGSDSCRMELCMGTTIKFTGEKEGVTAVRDSNNILNEVLGFDSVTEEFDLRNGEAFFGKAHDTFSEEGQGLVCGFDVKMAPGYVIDNITSDSSAVQYRFLVRNTYYYDVYDGNGNLINKSETDWEYGISSGNDAGEHREAFTAEQEVAVHGLEVEELKESVTSFKDFLDYYGYTAERVGAYVDYTIMFDQSQSTKQHSIVFHVSKPAEIDEGVKVHGNENITVKASDVTESFKTEEVESNLAQLQGDGLTIEKVYDINAAKGGQDITKADGLVNITVSADELTGNPEDYTVVYFTDEGVPMEMPTTYVEGQGIVFTTGHFSTYAVVKKTSNPTPAPGPDPTPGGLPSTTPSSDPTQSGTTTTTDLSGSTVSKGGDTTTTVDQSTADKLVDKAAANKSEEIVISAVTKNQSAAASTKSAEVTLPAETLGAIAEKTDADVVIKTDVAEVKLDNQAAEAIASQTQASAEITGKAETVSIIAEKVKEEAEEVRFELKVVTSSGKVISDFNGGSVSVTVNVPKSISNKKLVCVYIDENGLKHKVDGQLNADGTYTFTTGHFSTYAIMSEEDAEKAIAEQKAAVKAAKFKLRSQIVKTKSGKKAIRITWTNPTDIKFDGVEIYRSTKKSSGYGKKAIFVSKSGKYTNTSVKAGKKYYYKVRGFVTIDGEKVYTDWSYKAYRTVK